MVRRSDVRDFTFDIDTGIGSLLPPENEPIDFGELDGAVTEAGFELIWIEARVRGTLQASVDSQRGRQLAVRVENPSQLFILIEGSDEVERQGYNRILEWIDTGSREVVVRGRVHPHAGAAPGLTVRDFTVGG